MFLADLDSNRKRLYDGTITDPPEVPIEDIFSLFKRTKLLVDMHDSFNPR